jgi:hypothetical protein
MTERDKRLIREVMKLPAVARAALAGSLLESLDPHIDEDAEAAWGREIAKRVREVDSRSVRLIPWTTVRRRLLRSLHGAR